MITIIDYGLGNIRAFVNLYMRINIPVRVAKTKNDLGSAEKIILPGVGAFDHAMIKLNESGMRDELEKKVVDEKLPILGICVGMQMLANGSEEGGLPGLGWINSYVRRFDHNKIKHKPKLPHMGWNTVRPIENSLFEGLNNESRFYFLHSYYYECFDKKNEIASSIYGDQFTCAVNFNNIYGVQFHPEKSHNNGIKLLQNFAVL